MGAPITAKVVELFARGELVVNEDEALAGLKGFLIGLTYAYTRPEDAGKFLDQLHQDVPQYRPCPVDEIHEVLKEYYGAQNS